MAGSILGIKGSPCLFAGFAETYSVELDAAWSEAEKQSLLWTAKSLSDNTSNQFGSGTSATLTIQSKECAGYSISVVFPGDPTIRSALPFVGLVAFRGSRYVSPQGALPTVSRNPLASQNPARPASWRAIYPGQSSYLLGYEMVYQTFIGIGSSAKSKDGAHYEPEAWEHLLGPWAWVITPTVVAESKGNFDQLNSYDGAWFTFGLGQMSLHDPGIALVTLLRMFLRHDDAKEFFPEMFLDEASNLIKPAHAPPIVNNENDEIAYLRSTFNHDRNHTDNDEALAAARLVAWSRKQPALCVDQLNHLIKFMKNKLSLVSPGLLNSRTDREIIVIADILHQGRSNKMNIEKVLRAHPVNEAVDGLLNLGMPKNANRIGTIKRCLDALHDQLNRYRWNSNLGDLEPIPQPQPKAPVANFLPVLYSLRGIDQPSTAPENDNGIRLGFGYQLRSVSKQQFLADWNMLDPAILSMLVTVVGLNGDAARATALQFGAIQISLKDASTVFMSYDGPKLTLRAEQQWAGFSALSVNAQTALISLWLDLGMQLRDSAFGSGERKPLRKLRKGLAVGSAALSLAPLFQKLDRFGDAARRFKESQLFLT